MAANRSDEAAQVLWACKQHFATAAAFSLGVNLLYLAPALYMLQVYDRVLSGSSRTTLVMLTLALAAAFLCLVILDTVRSRILSRAGVRIDRLLAARTVSAALTSGREGAARSQSLRDLDTFRQFISGPGVQALFDMPWMPIFIMIIFVLHPILGAFAVAVAIILLVLLVTNEILVKQASRRGSEDAIAGYNFVEMILRNSDVARALGMMPGLLARWQGGRQQMMENQLLATDRGASMGGIIKFVRMMSQSLILGLGAYLVIEKQLSPGAIFAGVLLFGRAMQPIEQLVGSWRGMTAARESFRRLKAMLDANPPEQSAVELPKPTGHVTAEAATFLIPGTPRPVLRNLNFQILPGQALGVIGPSGSGKSTLGRAALGMLRPMTGAFRLDGADISTWPRTQLGRFIGYLPQDIELFADTIAANISRFNDGSDDDVIKAAQLAGVHDLILSLPNGYDTVIGEGGAVLPGGYRQRIALARAVYGDPVFVVLDEPSSNLDSEGDAALAECIAKLKARKTALIVVSHRPATLNTMDNLLVLRNGVAEMFGSTGEIMAKLLGRPQAAQTLAGPPAPGSRPAIPPGG